MHMFSYMPKHKDNCLRETHSVWQMLPQEMGKRIGQGKKDLKFTLCISRLFAFYATSA